MVVFIVPQHIMEHSDMWRSSTAAIESRGARLERIGRATVNRRGAVNGWASQKQQGGGEAQKLIGRSYNSSAVQQLLMKAAMTEEIWYGNGVASLLAVVITPAERGRGRIVSPPYRD
eukprot:6183666-Pleurochrysis_carterae.AAC.4